jgi:hypothetical protein
MGSYAGKTGTSTERSAGDTTTHENEHEKPFPMTRRSSGPGNLWGKQTIETGYALDTSDMELADERGAKMGGSTENVAHSLKGASVVSR